MQFYGASMCLPPVWQALKNQILTHTGVTTCDISKHWIGCKGSCTAYMQKAFLLWVGACASWDCELECRSSCPEWDSMCLFRTTACAQEKLHCVQMKDFLLSGSAYVSSGCKLVWRSICTTYNWKIYAYLCTMPHMVRVFWRFTWKRTMEKIQTNITDVTMHPFRQPIWGNTWKHTVK